MSIAQSSFYRWKAGGKKTEKNDEIEEKIEQLCMDNQCIYGYRTIIRLLKKSFELVVNRKKVYRITKEGG
ncbi:IS3 family transposase [Streptococcus pseudopneumoniae]|uniref:IS3 family transposase n=1 Tax=Streptococcus pseudopneumoniae TaxID=257758 RepID=UPI00128E3247|nr:IS3 family transposase [Streptococcus pseudopneumoniae]